MLISSLFVLLLQQAPETPSVAPAAEPSTGVRVAAGVGVGLGTVLVLGAVGAGVGGLLLIDSRCTYACELGRSLVLFGGIMIGGLVGLVVGPVVGWLVGRSLGQSKPQRVTLVPVITPARAGLEIILRL